MAKKDKEQPQKTYKTASSVEANLEDLSAKSNTMVYGTVNNLEHEADTVREIVRSTVEATNKKYGERSNGKVINYFNEINFSKAFSEVLKNPDRKKKFEEDPERAFREFMENENGGAAEIMLSSESDRILTYNNYSAIYEHIPECAQAVEIFKQNIISADDFTKVIFNLKYDDDKNSDLKKDVERTLQLCSKKYGFEEMADKIINNSLIYGDEYVSILSIDKELNRMLEDPVMRGNLNEAQVRLMDPQCVSRDLKAEDVEIDNGVSLTEAFNEYFAIDRSRDIKDNEKKEQILSEEEILAEEEIVKSVIADLINENVHIGSKKEFLLERYLAEKETANPVDMIHLFNNYKTDKDGNQSKKEDKEPINVNGSCIKVLDPGRVVELKVDNIIYGYYVFEDDVNELKNAYGPSAGRELDGGKNQMNLNTIYSPSINNTRFQPDISKFSSTGVGETKLELITRVFLNCLSKKLNKEFIRKNKQFKDFLYELVKQDYIIKKGVKLTFLSPDEVVAFNVPSVFRKITFFAKLYLATLTNNILINLGRAHDKRAYYIETGLDANYSNAINRVIQDIKTKEFKMSSMKDINTILSLSPGRFDDYFIPTVNGNRPLEIDTLPGMNADINNEFIDFLRKSMVNGTGVNLAMIDATSEVEFSRAISVVNANFVRQVIIYQKQFTPPFNKLMQIIYKNETEFIDEAKRGNLEHADYDKIVVQFPSPATLSMTAMTEQITVAEQNAEFISNIMVPQTAAGEHEIERLKLKAEIVKDLLPGIDWEKMEKLKEKVKIDKVRDDVTKGKPAKDEPDDPYGGQF